MEIKRSICLTYYVKRVNLIYRRFKTMQNKLITVRLNDNLHRDVMIKYEGSLSELVRTLLREFIDKKESVE